MKKIVLAGLLYNTNIGDRLLFDSSEYLLRKALPDGSLEFVRLDFQNRKKITNESLSGTEPKGIVDKINRKLHKGTKSNLLNFGKYNLWLINNRKSLMSYYDKCLENCDLLFFIGGGTLCYHRDNDCARYYYKLIQMAAERNIPVIINGIGVETPYNVLDYRGRMYKRAVNNSAVVGISTRNNTPELLRQYIASPSLCAECVADSAVWSAEAFGIQRDTTTNTIGIGVIAKQRFDECQRPISTEQYEFYLIDLVNKLNKKNKKWRLFTNGAVIDNRFLTSFCSKNGISIDKTDIPQASEDLVEYISKYSGIITSRLHSCIIACSLDIPFISIVWNDKLKMFASALNRPFWAVDDILSAEDVINRFDGAMCNGYDEDKRLSYRKSSVSFIEKAISQANQKRGIII